MTGLHLRRPGEGHLRRLLADAPGQELTYAPLGVSLDVDVETSLRRGRWVTDLPAANAFERGRAALEGWAVHRGSGLTVLADGELVEGTHVVLVAPLPVGFVDATCRVVRVVDEPDRFGFAYGTLRLHPERGEEAFLVIRDRRGTRFEVLMAASPVHPLARLVPPAATLLQSAAIRRYLAAMRTAAVSPRQ